MEMVVVEGRVHKAKQWKVAGERLYNMWWGVRVAQKKGNEGRENTSTTEVQRKNRTTQGAPMNRRRVVYMRRRKRRIGGAVVAGVGDERRRSRCCHQCKGGFG